MASSGTMSSSRSFFKQLRRCQASICDRLHFEDIQAPLHRNQVMHRLHQTFLAMTWCFPKPWLMIIKMSGNALALSYQCLQVQSAIGPRQAQVQWTSIVCCHRVGRESTN